MIEKGKTVVITGASSGFGKGAVKAFAAKGYRVWGTMRDAEGRNAEKKTALETYSNRVSVIDIDVADDELRPKADPPKKPKPLRCAICQAPMRWVLFIRPPPDLRTA
jgi:NAD(P)-dependent dehydrogenase (short-subunit alcohol dehydrogenase family)